MDKGVWRTVGGRRIFIAEGEDLTTAMKNSGKFGKKEEKSEKAQLNSTHKQWIEDELESALKDAKDLNKINDIKTNVVESLKKGGMIDNSVEESAKEYIENIVDSYYRREAKRRHEENTKANAEVETHTRYDWDKVLKQAEIGESFIDEEGEEYILAKKYPKHKYSGDLGGYFVNKKDVDKYYDGDIKKALQEEAGVRMYSNNLSAYKWKK